MHLKFINKKQSRLKSKSFRKYLCRDVKKNIDSKIINNLIKLDCYKSAETLFVYVSNALEINTIDLIKAAFNEGKRVAVPKCLGDKTMQFVYITSLSQLRNGSFNILEPKDNLPCADIKDCSLMVVPALAADIFGYRAGYGKGYYDRYLFGNKIVTAILCYENNIYFKIFHNRYDYKCSYIISENKVRKMKGD